MLQDLSWCIVYNVAHQPASRGVSDNAVSSPEIAAATTRFVVGARLVHLLLIRYIRNLFHTRKRPGPGCDHY